MRQKLGMWVMLSRTHCEWLSDRDNRLPSRCSRPRLIHRASPRLTATKTKSCAACGLSVHQHYIISLYQTPAQTNPSRPLSLVTSPSTAPLLRLWRLPSFTPKRSTKRRSHTRAPCIPLTAGLRRLVLIYRSPISCGAFPRYLLGYP